MLRNAFRLCVLSVAVVWLWVGLAHADDKKAGDKPKDGKIVLVIDASKLPPGLLKQLLPYAERPSTEKAEGKPKHPETKAKPPAKAAVAEAKKPNIVQVDLNKLSPDLAKRLKAELSLGKPKKDDDDRGGKGKAKKDDDRPGAGAKGKKHSDDDDDDKGKARGRKDKKDKDDGEGKRSQKRDDD
jgi:type IV secretory pathway VirB10-like protein